MIYVDNVYQLNSFILSLFMATMNYIDEDHKAALKFVEDDIYFFLLAELPEEFCDTHTIIFHYTDQ